MAADTTIQGTGLQRRQDGTTALPSGGSLDIESGGALKIAGTDKTSTLAAAVANPMASTASGKKFVGGSHSVTAGEDTANTTTIATGITAVSAAGVQIVRSGKVVSSDPAVSFSAGNLVVADGSSYVLTSGDVLNWWAFGA